jgi:AP-3 complex subunit delta-1
MCYKIFINAGDNEHMIEELTPYLSDRLKDSDASVRMAAIQVIYEITRINPSLFVFTIPQVFQLLSESTNNWVLIKLIKLLTELCGAEPRLINKLVPKFKSLLESQRAKSV